MEIPMLGVRSNLQWDFHGFHDFPWKKNSACSVFVALILTDITIYNDPSKEATSATFWRIAGVKRAVKVIHKSRLSVSPVVAEDEAMICISLRGDVVRNLQQIYRILPVKIRLVWWLEAWAWYCERINIQLITGVFFCDRLVKLYEVCVCSTQIPIASTCNDCCVGLSELP